jgi:DNA-binding response OmpR family regulator
MLGLRERLHELLEQGGHEVRSAANAVAAIEECKRFRPHIAIIDTSVADAHAAPLANHLRAHMEPRSLVLAMTIEPIAGWPAAAYDRLYVKPITGPELREAIEGWLSDERLGLEAPVTQEHAVDESWLSRPN